MQLRPDFLNFFLLVFILLSACSPEQHKYEFLVFGTLVELEIYDVPPAKADTVSQNIQTTFDDLHKTWHAWDKGGLLSDINQAIADGKPITLEPGVIKFLQKIKQLSLQSENNFNPGIGKLVALWGFHAEKWQGPPPADKDMAQFINPPISMNSIKFDKNKLLSEDSRIQIDLGAVAKGYALDLAIMILQQQGIKNAVVNAGGDLRVLGQKNQRAWNIGIKSSSGGAIGSIKLKNGESAISSGNYERKFIWQGKSYHHLINPVTGKPAQGISSVTVIDDNAMHGDVAATAILVAGIDRWRAIADKMAINLVLIIDDDNTVHMSEQMQTRVELK